MVGSCFDCTLDGKKVKDQIIGNRILFVGIAPGFTEGKRGIPFTGKAGRLLRGGCNQVNIDIADCSFANVAHCVPVDDNRNLRDPTKDEIKQCREALEKTISKVKPELIVPLGNIPLEWFLGRKVNITKEVGKLIEKNGYKLIPLFHPAFILRNPTKEKVFIKGLRRIKDYVYGTEFKLSKHFEENPPRSSSIYETLSDAEETYFDVETTSLDLFASSTRLLSCCVGADEKKGVVVGAENIERVRNILESDSKKVGHNCKFDLVALRKLADIKTRGKYDDLLIAHYLATGMVEGKHYSHNLKAVCREYNFPVSEVVEVDTKNMASLPREKLFEYNRQDVVNLARLFKIIPHDTWIYRFLCDCIPMLASMEYRGLPVDQEHLEHLHEKYESRLTYLKAQLLETVGKVKVRKGKKEILVDYNPNSDPQTARYLRSQGITLPKTKTKRDSVAREVLAKINHPFCKLMIGYSQVEKMLSTYIKPFIGKEVVHPIYNFHMTDTGRLSSSGDVNIQNQPRGGFVEKDGDWEYSPGFKEFRKLIKAPEGCVWVSVDYAQIEPKILALLAGETKLLNSKDVYSDMFYGRYKRMPTKDERQDLKPRVLGVMYGLNDKEMIEDFFGAFPRIAQWIKDTKREWRNGKIVVPFTGRVRRLLGDNQHKLEKLAVNTKIQSIASDINTGTAKATWLERVPGVAISILVHDESVYAVEGDKVDKVVPQLVEIARETPKTIIGNKDIDFKVDVEVGPNWGDLKAYERAG